MRLLLDIDSGQQPICGWLERPCSTRLAFTGLLELLTALEQLLADEPRDGIAQRG